MDFFKKNSYDMVRMVITQLGISVFALIMSFAFMATNIEKGSFWYIVGNVAISIFSTGFYYVLLYMSAWDWGAKDKIRIDAGRLSRNNCKVLLMGLIANAGNILIAWFAIICLTIAIICLPISSLGFVKFFYPAGAIAFLILYLSSHMFYGTTSSIFEFLKDDGASTPAWFLMQAVAMLSFFIITILVGHLGYSLGVRDKRIFGFIKTKPKKYE